MSYMDSCEACNWNSILSVLFNFIPLFSKGSHWQDLPAELKTELSSAASRRRSGGRGRSSARTAFDSRQSHCPCTRDTQRTFC